MRDVCGFPSIQKGAVRGVEFQHSAGKFLAGFLVYLAEMHYSLGVCNILQIHVSFVHFHRDGFLHGDVAGDSFQFSYLVVAVGGFKGELSGFIGDGGGQGSFFGELRGFRIEKPEGDSLQRSLLSPSFVAGDLASEQLVVELYGCSFIGCHSDCLASGDLVSGGEIALLLRHGVLARDQVLDVDLPSSIRSEGFRIVLALYQESEARQHAVLGGLLDQQAAFGMDRNGLCLIVDVCVGSNFYAVLIQRFKHHNGVTCQGTGVHRVGQFYSATAFLCHEFCFGSDLHAVHQEGFARSFVHKNTGNSVGLTGVKSGVLHHVHNGDFTCGVGSVLTIHRGGGADLRSFNKVDRLALIFQVLMASDLSFALEELLKDHQGLPFQPSGIEGKEHVNGSIGFGGSEGGLRSHLFLSNYQGFSGFLVHENTFQSILLANGQAGIFHCVSDGDLFCRLGSLFIINGCGCPNLRLPERYGLALIFQISVGCDQCFSLVQVLKNHHNFARKSAGIQGVGQLNGTIG